MSGCPWEYPNRDDSTGSHRVCGAPATVEVEYGYGGAVTRRVWYCANHAQVEALSTGHYATPPPIRRVTEREMAQRERAQAAMTRHMRGEPA